jgi:septal ring factor EnvC (AmiA/AmiB activator)
MRLGLSFKILLWVLFFPLLGMAQSRSGLEKKRKRLQQDIHYTNKLLRENKKKQEASTAQLQKVALNIQRRTELMGTLEKELSLMEREIDSTLKEIQQLETGLERLKKDYADLVRRTYIYGKTHHRWVRILSSQGIGEALRRTAYFERMEEVRRSKAIHVRQMRDTLAQRVNQLEQIRIEKTGTLEEMSAQAAALAAEKAEKERQVVALRAKEGELMAAIRKKQAESEQLSRKINEIIQRELAEARRKAEAEAKRKAEAEAKRRAEMERARTNPTSGTGNTSTPSTPSGGSTSRPTAPPSLTETPESAALSRDFSTNRGKLPWPVEKGVITGKFGRHPHPVFSHVEIQRDGVDISTERGAGVRAVFRGEVSTVIRMPGYEHVVILRHGQYMSVYGNLASVSVKKGDVLQTRQKMGVAYEDESSGRTQVHFRIMAGEVAENPELWLAR